MVEQSTGIVDVIAAVALVVAWFAFRVERRDAHMREVRSARAALGTVQHGMVEGEGLAQGWGEAYFSTRYEGKTLEDRLNKTLHGIHEQRFDQVFVVPTELVARLATASAEKGLITERTIAAAGSALWRLEVFNQMVAMQSLLNVLHATELVDPKLDHHRRDTLGEAATVISTFIHRDAIGRASDPDAWYGRLKNAIADNIAELRELEGLKGLVTWWVRTPVFILLDLGVLAILAIAIERAL